jgi:hypothetical protein
MTEREPWHNLSQWSLEELQEAERSYPTGHSLGEEMRAEIRRRQAIIEDYRARSYLLYLPLAIIVGIVTVAIAIYALIRHL